MSSDYCQLAGTVHIPPDQQKEFNENILTLLNYCGIRKTTTMILSGKTFTVTKPVSIDEQGNIAFDYSMLEKAKREVSTFNVKTGQFILPNSGYAEFDMACTLLKTMCQTYSDTPCYITHEGKLIDIKNWLCLLNYIFGRELPCRNGNDVWELYSFFHYAESFADLTPVKAWRYLAVEMDRTCWHQLETALTLDMKEPGTYKYKSKGIKEEIAHEEWWEREELLYRILFRYKNDDDFLIRLKDLLGKNLSDRRKAAEEDGDFGLLAELSLYYTSPAIIKLYSLAREEDFWQLWESLNLTAYTDVIEEPCSKSPKSYYQFPLYKAISRDSEDEFLYWWNGENLQLSDKLKEQLTAWKNDFDQLRLPPDFDVESDLAQILWEMDKNWSCPYVSRALVEEFLSHKTDIRYQKLLLVLKKFIDKGLEFFPELTRRQAIDWIFRRARDKQEIVHIGAFMTLLSNHTQRQRIFGV